jgi:acyl carrier protein
MRFCPTSDRRKRRNQLDEKDLRSVTGAGTHPALPQHGDCPHPAKGPTGMNHIASSLRQFIRENFLFGQEPTFADQDSLLELGIVDSTGVLELVTFIEDHYQITIEDEELVPENLDSIENLVGFIIAKCRQPLVLNKQMRHAV